MGFLSVSYCQAGIGMAPFWTEPDIEGLLEYTKTNHSEIKWDTEEVRSLFRNNEIDEPTTDDLRVWRDVTQKTLSDEELETLLLDVKSRDSSIPTELIYALMVLALTRYFRADLEAMRSKSKAKDARIRQLESDYAMRKMVLNRLRNTDFE
jgi:hypothetical protein